MVYAHISCERENNAHCCKKKKFHEAKPFLIVKIMRLISFHFIMNVFTYFILSSFAVGCSCHNFVIFIANELGNNDVSWNNEKVVTPNLDLLAKDGLLMDYSWIIK